MCQYTKIMEANFLSHERVSRPCSVLCMHETRTNYSSLMVQDAPQYINITCTGRPGEFAFAVMIITCDTSTGNGRMFIPVLMRKESAHSK